MTETLTARLTKFLILLVTCFHLFFAINSFADEKPEIFVQMGHAGQIRSSIFSKDGKYIVSGSYDNTELYGKNWTEL